MSEENQNQIVNQAPEQADPNYKETLLLYNEKNGAVEAVSEQEPVDIVVPISRTADFIRFINDLEAQSGMQMVSFGHAGDGNVHLCVVRGERDEETWQRELHENMDRAPRRRRLRRARHRAIEASLLPAPDGEGKFTGHERHQNGARPAAYLEQRKILSHRRKQ